MRLFIILGVLVLLSSCHYTMDIKDDVSSTDSYCGDGVVDSGEECEIGDLNGETCETLDFNDGTLSCNSSCQFDTSLCQVQLTFCGNGVVEGREQCENQDLGGLTCDSLGYGSGELSCLNCYYDVSNCSNPAVCGDGEVDSPVEECDSDLLNGAACISLGYSSGTLLCDSLCHYDTSGCQPSELCGNGTIDSGEDCDLTEFGDSTCTSLGYSGGTLQCDSLCIFDESNCDAAVLCGNGDIDANEDCDLTNLNNETCSGLGFLSGGTLACNSTCQFDISGCSNDPLCGDGSVDLPEECDGDNLSLGTCENEGYWRGTLGCLECSYDYTDCSDYLLAGTSFLEVTYSSAITPNGSLIQAGYIDSNSFYGNSTIGKFDNVIIKYDASGAVLWTKQWGSSEDDLAHGVAVYGNSDIYVVGKTSGSIDGVTAFGSDDMFITKFSSSGTKIWTKIYGTTLSDYARAVTVDSLGNVFIVGITEGTMSGTVPNGEEDIFLIKINANGTPGFTKQFGTSSGDIAIGLALDSSSNIIITGYTSGVLGTQNFGNSDVFVMKLSPLGILTWVKQWGSTLQDQGNALDCDASGNIYVAGLTSGGFNGNSSSGNRDMFLMKVSSTGADLWSKQFGSSADDQAWAVKYRSDSAIYVGGHSPGVIFSQPNIGAVDAIVVKYDSLGNFVESNTRGGNGNDFCNSMILGISSGVYCTGATDGSLPGQASNGNYDFFIISFPE
jgi:Beta-propeller repeat